MGNKGVCSCHCVTARFDHTDCSLESEFLSTSARQRRRRRQKTKDKRQKTKGQKTKDKRQKTKDKRQKTKDKRQKDKRTKDKRQKGQERQKTRQKPKTKDKDLKQNVHASMQIEGTTGQQKPHRQPQKVREKRHSHDLGGQERDHERHL